jgi:hypothetical protein
LANFSQRLTVFHDKRLLDAQARCPAGTGFLPRTAPGQNFSVFMNKTNALQFRGSVVLSGTIARSGLTFEGAGDQTGAHDVLPPELTKLHGPLRALVSAVRRVFGLVGQNEALKGP